jgi:hypothetical protein
MKNKYIVGIVLSFALFGFFVNTNVFAQTTAPAKKPVATAAVSYITVSPLDLVDHVSKYLNKNITFTGEFVAYTSLGLDYKPAFRDAQKYIGVLIRRPDVTTHTIPLSEVKMFLKRDVAEKNVDLDQGDKIKIEGKVFSDALGDPWVDITNFTVISKKAKSESK